MTSAFIDPRDGLDLRLLPHTGAARLLTAIVRSEPGFLEAIGRVGAEHPLACRGKVPSFLGLELGAQAAAAMEALHHLGGADETARRSGYLVRVREAAFTMPDLPANTPLLVTARLEAAASPLAIHRISVRVEGVECVTAVIGTFSRTR